MKTTKRSRREAKQLFLCCRQDGVLNDERVRKVVKQVIDQKPRGYFAILTHFERLVRLEIDRRTARVESSTALPADQQQSIQASLVRKYGQGLTMEFSQNPALIGGVRIKVGSSVLDGTIRSRLDTLEEKF
jgi:F-type H+-transporting ATPase subunit delta